MSTVVSVSSSSVLKIEFIALTLTLVSTKMIVSPVPDVTQNGTQFLTYMSKHCTAMNHMMEVLSHRVQEIESMVAVGWKDVTIPDNTVIAIGTTITKVWRILNVGTDAWVNCELVAASSLDEMLGPTSTTLDLPFCLGGCWCDVAVEFCIPESAAIGCTRSTWHLHSGDGQRFDVNYCRDLFMDVEVVPE